VQVNGVQIEDTFAEAFPMWGARVVITAATPRWALVAARTMTGFATSVIGCGCEAAVERFWPNTPDGRPGVAVLVFATSRDRLRRALVDRIGQAVMTCPTTACYSGLLGEESVPVGSALRYFGDGFQRRKRIGPRRYWRIPVMDGEFVVEEHFGVAQAVGGGNFLILGRDEEAALEAARAAVRAARTVEGVALPFPGGIVRSGSKVGSRYRFLTASTSDPYCPVLRTRTQTALPPEANAVYEIVIDGLGKEPVREAMRRGILAACREGVVSISAANFGGRLGPYHFRLREILAESLPLVDQ
jgi:formylmethanofuran--tetrahydromethanopterin N-formyltransferase